ncbi:GNAT family N-acetyltransferase [Mastigocoleus testarum]|uniref:N-acetyltransferase domain-containing protein n=1 Tax=Mastigocoleus testarum BC008 TaxID=371196 RepID=A0A0V7ZNG0_9CYAN|nr:GNAT family protein [Mastigocoleus testarum]KST65960.1 hypothetical protein BC008_23575 [Mastigocoleus testarum BC008]
MNENNARIILNWRYEKPYDFYNPDSSHIEENIQEFTNPQNAYYSLTNSNSELVAHCCFGTEARVSDGNYSVEALDIGLGMNPRFTKRGLALRTINAIIDFGNAKFLATLFRVTVAEFNQQALRICEKAGFKEIERFQRKQDGKYFLIMILNLENSPTYSKNNYSKNNY